jgi:probable rRNA maturation factor
VREASLPFDDEWVTRVVTAAVVSAGRRTPTTLTVLFADDGRLRDLNHAFRGLDKATDVLSFDAGGSGAGTVGPLRRRGGWPYIGDVAISVPRAFEQADRHGHGVPREVGYLLVHGVLHLLGFDHEVDDDQVTMRLAEEAALARVNLSIPPSPASAGEG